MDVSKETRDLWNGGWRNNNGRKKVVLNQPISRDVNPFYGNKGIY